MTDKVLIIGGTGFIGSPVVKKLISSAAFELIVCTRSIENVSLEVKKSANILVGDWKDRAFLEKTFEQIAPSVVIHMANAGLPSTSNFDVAEDVDQNLLPSIYLFECCAKYSVKKIVYASSGGAIYGDQVKEKLSERDRPIPISSYGILKHTTEQYLSLFRRLHGVEYISLRVSNPYGPGQNPLAPQGVVAVFMNRILKNMPIQVWGDGSVERDYIYIDDVVDAFVSAIECDHSGYYNIGSGVGKKISEVISSIETITKNKSNVSYQVGRVADVERVVLDCTKAKHYLRWNAKNSFEDGLANTKNWLETTF